MAALGHSAGDGRGDRQSRQRTLRRCHESLGGTSGVTPQGQISSLLRHPRPSGRPRGPQGRGYKPRGYTSRRERRCLCWRGTAVAGGGKGEDPLGRDLRGLLYEAAATLLPS
jgi:hypothetical protein